MCGICGILDLKKEKRIERNVLERMTKKLSHRGPDGFECFSLDNIGLGFTRLSIIDLEMGMQPIRNEDGSLILICNGEIFNYIELRDELIAKGHSFRTGTDVEVLLHLYEEYGARFLNRLNAQFAFALYDFKNRLLFCARDHFGVIPFYFTTADGYFIFGSEIKSILGHPSVKKEVDLTGLDQVFSFPGLISPRTMFKDIKSLENGHYLIIKDNGSMEDVEYWDLHYPEIGEITQKPEDYYRQGLYDLISRSVELRLRSDVPVGLYISGGLDSSIISAITFKLLPVNGRHSFAIDFREKEISEGKYQRLMSQFIHSFHHEILFEYPDISKRIASVIYHCECPLKETYNTASLALSESVRSQGIKVILSGEGSDEFFAGYVGYRFDKFRQMQSVESNSAAPFEEEIREKLWGDKDFFYEKNHFSFSGEKKEIYSNLLNESFESINCLNHYVVKKERLRNRDIIHKRSYLDYKLRLTDHLVSDHGDRMGMANSVEARYPFLDKDLVEFVALIPPALKLKDFQEKYILKKMAKGLIPNEILKREKFGFVVPGSPYILKRDIEFIDDLLSYERIKKQGYFNPDTIEKLKQQYVRDDFTINAPFDSDMLIIALTFGLFLEQFKMPELR
jgi:asparagine synthase (glutamine-hydrolysing)